MILSQPARRMRLSRALQHLACWPALMSFLLLAGCTKPAPPPQSAIPVVTAEVKTATMPLELSAVGTVEPIQTVAIRAQVSGTLIGVEFTEGQDVKANQVLFRIDPRPYQVALKQAQAALERDRFQAAHADRETQRYQGLAQKNYVPQEQYESLRTSSDAYRSTLDADAAAVDQAKLNLEYCTILSPITGRTGSILVKVGNLVKVTDANPLVVINQLDPVLVKFSVPEPDLPRIQKAMGQRTLAVKAFPGDGLDPVGGMLVFIDNQVDATTATIALKGRFGNADLLLWPGHFVDVRLLLDTQADALVVPSQAVQIGQAGSFVFVMAPDRTVAQRPVNVDRVANGLAVIRSGLKLGEQVIADGQLRLTTGARVEPKEPAAPDGGAAP